MGNITNQSLDSFLQSEDWAKIQGLLGYQTEKIGTAYFYERPLFGTWYYFYSPRTLATVSEIKEFLSRRHPLWLRFEPLGDVKKYSSLGKVNRTIDVQPAQTLVLDLSLSTEDLLKGMHQKTRYNIRLAEKKGIEIVEGKEYLDDFLQLMQTTTSRDGFKSHSANYYRQLLSSADFIKLMAASYQGKILAAGLFCFYGNTVTYLHGASSDSDRQLMAPYLLQWTVIQRAKQLGHLYYDFFGISQKKWPGVTRFKTGFGGEVIDYPGAYDLIIRPIAYRFYTFLRRLRRLI
ncbi:MAG TPA: peptidoglycan bridge formation glycyltransferase FemA/FemB family protein [bacterium]|nr:peptidoglycan bridge formation glycyltransferase FemA/FemB family protein [bacterium]HPT29801.1 peptidoglycan bridge formation glycyltransferase FemA/FemB family protein [bacterium]